MAHFAKIENNVVVNVLVVDNEHESYGQDFLNSIGLDGTWLQTSYNATIRKNFAGIGFTYDEDRDAFIPPKPFDSWLLNEETCTWKPPVDHPNDGLIYLWDESSTSWQLQSPE